MITANRYHDISVGHTVTGHESKCAHLHGHNYRIHFAIKGNLDSVGRVIDFSVIKQILCEWLEQNWDHKFLVYEQDERAAILKDLDPNGVVVVAFNPTAENMAKFLLDLSYELLPGNVVIEEITIEETRKCSVTIKN